jgi:hypothetical protein
MFEMTVAPTALRGACDPATGRLPFPTPPTAPRTPVPG